MMTYLRYWALVGFSLLAIGITAGLADLTSKWTHVVVGLLAVPLVWSLHFFIKRKWCFRDPESWAWLLALLVLASSLFSGNPYNALLGWISLVVGLLVWLAVRSFTNEHRPIFFIGLLLVGAAWVGWSLLVLHTSVHISWLPAIAKDPAALAGFAVLPLAVGILSFKRQTIWKNVALGVACVIVALPLFLPSTYQRLHQDWRSTAVLTRSFVSMVSAHPWLGIGVGNAQYLYPVSAPVRTVIIDRAPSSVLDIVTSYGIVGTLLFIAILVTTLAGLCGRSRRTKWVLVLAIVATQALCWVANLWQYPALWLSWWVLLGLVASPILTQEVSDFSTRRIFRASLLILSCLIGAQAIVMGLGLNRFAAAERAAQSGDTKSAASLYAQSLRFDPDPEQRRAYAESLWLNTYQNKDLAEAERQARLAYQWNRDDAFARQVAGRVAFSESKYAEAERLYREALDRDPYFSLDIYTSLADVYKKQGKTAEEKAILQEGLTKYPTSPTVADVAYPVFLTQLQQMQKRLGE